MIDDCIFCKIVNGEVNSQLVGESEKFLAILDAHPCVEGHTLIISKKHFETILDVPNNFGSEFLGFVKKISLNLMEKYNADGFNILGNSFKSAGQIVNHFHFHIIPRKKGDGFKVIN